MSDLNNQKIKAIILVQNWGAGKIPIGTQYKLKDSDRVLKLVESEEFSHGKFVFDDGEEFNIGKYFDSFFLEILLKDDKEEERESIFDEDVWNQVEKQLNKDEHGIIRQTLGALQINESFHDMLYYDVTDIIDAIKKNEDKGIEKIDSNLVKKLYGYLIYNNYPFFTKEKLYALFANCKFKQTKNSNIFRVINDNEDIGYLISESGKYFYAPKSKELSDEYKFEDNNSTGFFYTAENYLDIALSTLERYNEQFVPLYNNKLDKSNVSFGYQADASIITLLAFSCECYLKSLIINNGKDLNTIKGLGHGLSVLFSSLNSEQIGNVFNYMERQGYNMDDIMHHQTFETNILIDKFMLDLAKVDDAFVDARYSAEGDKNTDYNFLYRFALALRHCSKKEFLISSPFDESIESSMNRKYI